MKKLIAILFLLICLFACKKEDTTIEPEPYSSNYNIITYEVECDSCFLGDFSIKDLSDFVNNEWYKREICVNNQTYCNKEYRFSASKKFSKTLAIPKDSSIKASINVFYNAYPNKQAKATVRIKLNNKTVAERFIHYLEPFIKAEYPN